MTIFACQMKSSISFLINKIKSIKNYPNEEQSLHPNKINKINK
jgi:hypothetical protein